ncbi:MAG: phage portal protein [Pirellulales bacterium]
MFGKPKTSSTSAKRRVEYVSLADRLSRVWASFWDATRPDRFGDDHFRYADGASADAHATPQARAEIRNRARFEAANNGWLKGMGRTYQNDLVGTGPRLQIVDTDPEVARELEKKFHQWLRDIRFARKLRALKLAKRVDGEGIGVFYPILTDEARERFCNPVKIGFRLLECDRLADAMGSLGIEDRSGFVDGIKFDEYGHPVQYRFLKQHPGSLQGIAPIERDPYQVVDAKWVVHCFELDRPEQTRGVSEYQAILTPAYLLRQYVHSVVRAARNAARLFGFISTNLPPIETQLPGGEIEVPRCEPGATMALEDDLLKVLPDGYSADLVKAEQPTSSHKDFVRQGVNELGRPVGMPLNKSSGNSSDYNYASGRLDHQDWQKGISVERADDEIEICDKAFEIWLTEAVLVEDYLSPAARNLIGPDEYPPLPEHRWHWDGFEHVDPQKEANAQTERLRNGTTHLGKEWAKAGSDARQELESAADFLGVSVEEYQSLLRNYLYGSAQPAGKAPANDPTSDPTEDEPAVDDEEVTSDQQ